MGRFNHQPAKNGVCRGQMWAARLIPLMITAIVGPWVSASRLGPAKNYGNHWNTVASRVVS